jgi:anaerobic magnesium-protoporphyrin IX monomethyl ester cyclase
MVARSVADLTLINLNMLFVRCGEEVDRERHVPLGPLYLTRALERAGIDVDFRDAQCSPASDPFTKDAFLDFSAGTAPLVGLSCMANLLPFAILAAGWLKDRDPRCRVVLGGVGAAGVEEKVLERFPWIDVVSRGEGEVTGPELVRGLQRGDVSEVAGISYRAGDGRVVRNPDRARIEDPDAIPWPAFERVDLGKYAGYGMLGSRGCPYPCTFCSVAPVWNRQSISRSPRDIVDEMRFLHREAGVKLFLFQDEFFVSGKHQVLDFCRALRRARLPVRWKAFGRVNLADEEMMRAMARCGCVELRFGIESGCDEILQRIRKGFTAREVLELIPKAIKILSQVDVFYVWGFPFETMAQFNATLFQMIALRAMGARVLPSLLSLLPQTDLYREYAGKAAFEFCPYLMPEFVLTGHEVSHGITLEIPPQHAAFFRLVESNPDIFPGFFHVDLEANVLPKLRLLRQFGFYPPLQEPPAESCGAHSPRLQEALAGI